MSMIFGLAMLAHATLLAVVAFFVLFAASRAAGWIKALGSALGIWVLIVAGVGLICAVAAPFVGGFLPQHAFGPGMMQAPGMIRGDGQRHMRWRALACPPSPNPAAPDQAPAAQEQTAPTTP